jgi:hypothetical protein
MSPAFGPAVPPRPRASGNRQQVPRLVFMSCGYVWVTKNCPAGKRAVERSTMNVFTGAVRVLTRSVDVTVAAAGALSGAAINGVVGGVQGAVTGARRGLDSGRHSTPAAALTLAAIGATGLVEWPVVLLVGGTALAVRQLDQRARQDSGPRLSAVPDAPVKASARGASAPKKADKTPARKAVPRKASARKPAARRRATAAKR